MNPQAQTELEAAAFRSLVKHLDGRKDVQNIDLMILAGFCRNCMSKWLLAAADEKGVAMNYDEAREHVYRMPYGEWKENHQLSATEEQRKAFSAMEKAKVTVNS
ncbi:MAG: DUF1244 domain-containing protein [Methylophilaceae bacterium]|nr:DUF1244 domain-containing protein [Methylophilaceae bacterium]MDE1062171.1 DUF1244 domain-containing protein [Pseudomonadales bacterium]